MTSVDAPVRAWQFVRFATVVYAVMALIGLAVVHFAGGGGGVGGLGRAAHGIAPWKAYAGGLLVAGIMLVSSGLFSEWYDSFRDMRRLMKALMGNLPPAAIVWIAVCSAVGEEMLFRAAIQPHAGIVATSVIFGLMHIGPDRRVGAWTLWATGAGMLLGWVYQQSGLIAPVMLAHCLVNAWSLLRIRYAAIEE